MEQKRPVDHSRTLKDHPLTTPCQPGHLTACALFTEHLNIRFKLEKSRNPPKGGIFPTLFSQPWLLKPQFVAYKVQ